MDFELTEEQQMVRDMAARFAKEQIKPVAMELDKTHRHPEEIIAAVISNGPFHRLDCTNTR